MHAVKPVCISPACVATIGHNGEHGGETILVGVGGGTLAIHHSIQHRVLAL